MKVLKCEKQPYRNTTLAFLSAIQTTTDLVAKPDASPELSEALQRRTISCFCQSLCKAKPMISFKGIKSMFSY